MTEHEKTTPDAAAAPNGTRATLLPAPDLHTVYANTFQVSMAKDEVLLTACVSRQEKDQQGPLLVLQQQAQLAMTPANAKRLALVLGRTIAQYEEQFGPIS